MFRENILFSIDCVERKFFETWFSFPQAYQMSPNAVKFYWRLKQTVCMLLAR